MRAAVYDRYGPPDVVRVTEIDRPIPKDDELLVRVNATTVNRTDCGFRAGKPRIVRFFSGLRRPKAKVLGNEFSGEVAAVGSRVASFAIGDRVFGYNEGSFGGHAEYVTVRENSMVAAIPSGVTFQEAAPATEGSHYALSFIRAAKVQSGQSVLVYGATGAIGSAAVQILKSLGATVTAVCATPHLDLIRGLGADRVIDYTTEDFTKVGGPYDVVLDAVGKISFGRCKRVLKPRGIYLSTDFGPKGQNPFLALITPLFRRRRVMFPLPKQQPEMATYFRELIESGQFKPLIDRHYPLDQIVEAYEYVEAGQKVGNVVITLT